MTLLIIKTTDNIGELNEKYHHITTALIMNKIWSKRPTLINEMYCSFNFTTL